MGKWTKARTKPNMSNSKSCISLSDVKWQRVYMALSFQLCWLENTFLSWAVPAPVCSSSQQTSHGSGISDSFKSSRQSRLPSQSFTPWPLWGCMKGLPCHTHGFPWLQKKTLQSLHSSILLESNSRAMWPKLLSSACLGRKLALSLSYVCISFPFLLLLRGRWLPRPALFTGRRSSRVGITAGTDSFIPFLLVSFCTNQSSTIRSHRALLYFFLASLAF